MGFSISIDPPRSVRTRQATLQCCGQTLLDKLLTHSPNRRGADFQGLVDLLIGPAWPFFTRISFEQNPGVEQFPCCSFSC
jgi:hypothetical protein